MHVQLLGSAAYAFSIEKIVCLSANTDNVLYSTLIVFILSSGRHKW